MNEPDPLRFTCASVDWEVESDRADLLRREVLERVRDLDALPAAQQFKRTVRRTLYRVALTDGRTVIVKVFRLISWRDRLKHRLLGGKAEAEWLASRRLLEMGVPASHALAVGRPVEAHGNVGGYLVVDVEPGVHDVNSHLRALADAPGSAVAAAQLQFLRDLACFIRGLHDKGLAHHDLHGGNILVRAGAPTPEQRFLAIDLHRIRIGRPPGPRHRARAIALLVRTLRLVPAAEEQATDAFLRAYVEAGPPLSTPYLAAGHVLRLMERQHAERLRSRGARCLRDSRRYAVDDVAGWRIYRRRDFSADAVLALIERHKAAVGPSAPPGPTPRISHHRGEQPGDPLLEVREFPPARLLGRLYQRIVGSPGVREYAEAHRQRVKGRPGPRPVAAVEPLRGGGNSFAILEIGGPPSPAPSSPLSVPP